MELFSLFGRIAVENSEANAAIDETSGRASSFGETLSAGISTVASWSAAIVTGATAAAGALVAFATQSAETADHVDKMSQQLQISREAYQELDFICSQSGTSVDGLQAGIRTLTGVLADSQQAASNAAVAEAMLEEQLSNGEITLDEYNQKYDDLYASTYDACGGLKELGFSLMDIENMSTEEALFAVIEKLQAMPDDANRAALAQQLLGRSAMELTPLLNSGVGSIEEMRMQAQELGLVLSDEVIDSGVSLNDTMDALQKSFESVTMNLAGALMPIIEQFAQYIIDNMPMIQSLINQLEPVFTSFLNQVLPLLLNLIEQVFPLLSDAIVAILPLLVSVISQILPPIVSLISQVMPMLISIVDQIFPIFVELLDLLLPPIMEIVSALLPVLLEILNPILGLLDPILGLLSPLIDILMLFLDPLLDLIDLILPPLVELLASGLTVAIEAVSAVLVVITEVLSEVFGAALEALQPIIDDLKEKIENAFAKIKEKIDEVSAWIQTNLKDRILDAKNKVVETFTNLKEDATNLFNGLWENIKSVINWILGGIESMANGVVRGVNTVINALNNLEIDVPDWVTEMTGVAEFGFNIPTIPEVTIPMLASGGILEKGQVGLLEGNGAEAVVPLENNKKWISKVSEDMQAQGIGGSDESISLLKEVVALLANLPEDIRDAIADGLKFSLNNREFARMVKAVN